MSSPKVELAAAYISLVPSLKGAKGEIENSLSGAVTPKTGKAWGASLTKGLKLATAAGGATAAVGAAAAFKKGFDRLVSLDSSKARLKGLGLDPKEVKRVAEAAGKAVDGTAFSLADSVSASVAAIGAGVKKSDLTPWLKTVGDMTAQSKTDFGSMAAIMAKVTGEGRVMGDALAQLSDNGIHAVGPLAAALGKTQAEVREMASKGKISAELFGKVMNKQFGGSAQAMGETFTGAWDNMWAAAGRTTANLMSGVFPLLVKAMNSLRKHIKSLEAPAAVLGQRLGEWASRYGPPALNVLGTLAKAIGTTVGLVWKFRDVIALLGGAFLAYKTVVLATNVAGWALYLWQSRTVIMGAAHIAITKAMTAAQLGLNGALRANPIGSVITAITLLVGAAVLAYKRVDWFRKGVDAAWKGIRTAVKFAWDNVIKPVFKAYEFYLTKILAPAIKWLWTNAVKPVFDWIGSKVTAVWSSKVKPAFDKFREGLTALRAGFKTVKDYITSNWGTIAAAITAPIEKAKKILNGFFGGIDKVMKIFSGGKKSFGFRFDVGNSGASSATMNRPRGGIGAHHLAAARGAIGGKGGKGGGGKTWPANTRQLSRNYAGHSGIDIAAAGGSPIKAAQSGVIDYVGWGRGYGNAIFQSLGGGLSAVYGHSSKALVKAGQMVRAGQTLGLVGSTGNSSGNHLHFEVNGAGPFGSPANRAATLAWLGGAKMSGKGGGISMPKIPGLSLPGWIGGLGGMIRGWAGSWLKGQVFDTGGILGHGGVAVNLSGRPERIMSPAQTAKLDAVLARPLAAPTGVDEAGVERAFRRALNGSTFHMASDGSLRLKTLAG